MSRCGRTRRRRRSELAEGGQGDGMRDAQSKSPNTPISFSIASAIRHMARDHHARRGRIDRGRPERRHRRLQHHLAGGQQGDRPGVRGQGAHFLDAPCTGSKPGAEKATLTFMVGGDQAAFDKAMPYFEMMGKVFYYCGADRQGPAGQADPEPDPGEHYAGLRRRNGAGHQRRHRARA